MWETVGGPVDDLNPPGGLDAVTWTWEIERGDQRREITIIMARSLHASTGHPSTDAAVARETKGRNYVEAVLDRDDPPRFREADTAHTLADSLVDRSD